MWKLGLGFVIFLIIVLYVGNKYEKHVTANENYVYMPYTEVIQFRVRKRHQRMRNVKAGWYPTRKHR